MVIAGEASGDLHGAGLVREMKKRLPALDVFGIGGDRMKNEGMELVYHISSMSIMGFAEVVKNLLFLRSVERKLEGLLHERRPDVVVLIDYPGFNIRFARKVKQQGIKVLYYISPQIWAWHKSRVKKVKRYVDRMKVVLPFEVDMYKEVGIDVEFVGHPLLEVIGSSVTREHFFAKHGLDRNKKLLGLLPGSRTQEVENILPTMAEVAAELCRSIPVQAAIGVAANLGLSTLRRCVSSDSAITFVEHGTYELMANADAAIVTSGTATLEAGWFGTPMAVVYKTSPLTFFLGRMLVDVPNIGLVNIVAGTTVVPEFIQNAMTVENLVRVVGRLLQDDLYAQRMRNELSIIKTRLGGPGASARVADGVIALAEAT